MAAKRADRKIALLSIRPKYADLIATGKKRVEFRRTRFRNGISHVLVYATKPIQAIIGCFKVSAIDVQSPRKLWAKYRNISGLDRDEFASYFESCEVGVAIAIGRVELFNERVPLALIDDSFAPPQSFSYLSVEEFERVCSRGRRVS